LKCLIIRKSTSPPFFAAVTDKLSNMKQVSSRSTIWTSVKPFYWVSKVLGLAIFTIDGDVKSGRIKIDFRHLIYFALILCGQGYAVYVNMTTDLSLSKTKAVLIDQGAYLIGIFSSINVFIATTLYAYRCKKIWKIIRMLFDADNEVSIEIVHILLDLNHNFISFFNLAMTLTGTQELISLELSPFC
jgi:hypothetical protein